MNAHAMSARSIPAATSYRHRENTRRFPSVPASLVVGGSNGTHGHSRQTKYWMTGVNQQHGQRGNPYGGTDTAHAQSRSRPFAAPVG
jgi:hypothetical protein